MRSLVWWTAAPVAAAVLGAVVQAGAAGPSCTACGPAGVPRCRATWEEKKTKAVDYEIRCEYACARDRDPWHAPPPDCRCRPACGVVYVKKRLHKHEGEATVERAPKYEVELVSPRPCGCGGCAGPTRGCDPFGILSWFGLR